MCRTAQQNELWTLPAAAVPMRFFCSPSLLFADCFYPIFAPCICTRLAVIFQCKSEFILIVAGISRNVYKFFVLFLRYTIQFFRQKIGRINKVNFLSFLQGHQALSFLPRCLYLSSPYPPCDFAVVPLVVLHLISFRCLRHRTTSCLLPFF